MSDVELRIQLEGAFERIEGAVERCEAARRSLLWRKWPTDSKWLELSLGLGINAADEAALERRADAPEAAALLERLRTARRRLQASLARRLHQLGSASPAEIERAAVALHDELPVYFRGTFNWSSLWFFGVMLTLVGLGVIGTAFPHGPHPADYCVQPPLTRVADLVPGIFLAGWGASVLLAAWLLRVPVTLTRRRLMVRSRSFPVEAIQAVIVESTIQWGVREVCVLLRDGSRYRWHVDVPAKRFEHALKQSGIPTQTEVRREHDGDSSTEARGGGSRREGVHQARQADGRGARAARSRLRPGAGRTGAANHRE
jgi:hypothetical protein